MFYCYILYSPKLDKYYVGHSHDVGLRLTQHNSGISAFTSKADDWIQFTNKHLRQESLHGAEKMRSKRKRAVNISNGSFRLTRRLHAPKAFGEEVIGSTPIFSTFRPGRPKGDLFFMGVLLLYFLLTQFLDRYYTGHAGDTDMLLIQHNCGFSTAKLMITNPYKKVKPLMGRGLY